MNKKTEELQKKIEIIKKENTELRLNKLNLKVQTSRYYKIFNKLYISMWEEDVSEVYNLIETFPCNSGEELSEYLTNNPDQAQKAIRRIKVIQINDYTIKLFQSSNKNMLLSSLKALTKIVSLPGFIKLFKAMKDNVSSSTFETNAFTIGGQKLDILLTIYFPGRYNGNILISMIDISERKLHEDTIKNNLRKVKKQKQRTEVLQSIIFSLTSSLDKEEILKSILIEAKKIIPYSCANIRLLKNGYLTVAVSFGYNKFGAENFINGSSLQIEKLGDSEIFLKSGVINIISDTRNYFKWTTFPETSYIRGYIGIPIKWKDQTLGLLSLESDKINTFTQSDAENLKPFANAAAVALHNSRLFDIATKEVLKRETTETIIKKSLKEKEILLREIHHRVKNNLTIIMSLINLQGAMLPDNIDPYIFEDLKQKIYTISLVHKRLYRSKNLSSVDLKLYLSDLTESVKLSSMFKEGIQFFIETEERIEIEATILVPLALLLNELIVNSVKYAFPDKPGIISIIVIDEGKYHKIIFRDNGIGIPEKRDSSASELGLFLVESLISQINGSVSFYNDGGAVTAISFPKK